MVCICGYYFHLTALCAHVHVQHCCMERYICHTACTVYINLLIHHWQSSSLCWHLQCAPVHFDLYPLVSMIWVKGCDSRSVVCTHTFIIAIIMWLSDYSELQIASGVFWCFTFKIVQIPVHLARFYWQDLFMTKLVSFFFGVVLSVVFFVTTRDRVHNLLFLGGLPQKLVEFFQHHWSWLVLVAWLWARTFVV